MEKLDTPGSPFVVIDPLIFQDRNLSWRAKGIYAYLLSKVYGYENVRFEDLLDLSLDDKQSLNDAIRELIQKGYMVEQFIRKE
jgi:hypothetical protein